MQFKKSLLTLGGMLSLATFSAYATTTINFWHSMEGTLGDEVNRIVNEFNKSQSEYKVIPTYKGGYSEAMNAGIAAYRAKQAPDILQVFEVGTATMMYSNGAIQPVQELSEKVSDPIKYDDFVPGIAAYYSENGKLVSMPFNSSTPVLYYNKDLFQKAGLDPNKPPKTYQEVREYAKKLKAAGVECGYTSSWPAWVLVENFAAIHNVPYTTEDNGFKGLGARLLLDKETMWKKHFEFLDAMAKEGTFTYAGRADAANGLFFSGKCGMFTGSSGSRSGIIAAKLNFGTSTLPYYADVKGAPNNSVIGGASLWAFSNGDDARYKGVIKFFQFLTSPKIAAEWHMNTGYVPVVKAAYDYAKNQGYYQKNPGADVAFNQLSLATVTNSRGVRLGDLPKIRDIEEGDMEQLFAGKMTVDQALKDITERGNQLLERFQKQHSK